MAAHWSVHKDRPLTVNVLELLRQRGTNLQVEDAHGRTCLDLDSRFPEDLARLRSAIQAGRLGAAA